MRYLADDGKDFGTEKECLEYEQQVLKAEQEKKREEKARQEQIEKVYRNIQDTVNIINGLVDNYKRLTGKQLYYTELENGHLKVSKPSDNGLLGDPLDRMLHELGLR